MNPTISRQLPVAFCALLLAAGLSLAGGNPPGAAAYVEGTVTEVPAPVTGNLDLSSKEKLRFRFEKSSFDIPYAAIVGIHPGRKRDGLGAQFASGAAMVGRTVLPVFFPDNKYITVDFRRETSTNTERMVFQLPQELAEATVPVLETRAILARPAKPRPSERIHNDDGWWGHSWWRTDRNRHLWRPISEVNRPPEPAPASK